MDTMFEQASSQEHFTDILLEVNRRVAEEFQSKGGNKQMPCSITMLTKKLYFRPGFYEHGSLASSHEKGPGRAYKMTSRPRGIGKVYS